MLKWKRLANASVVAALIAAFTLTVVFDLTVGVAFTFNFGAAAMLGIIEAVTQTPPTSCTTDSCTWGPGHGPFAGSAPGRARASGGPAVTTGHRS